MTDDDFRDLALALDGVSKGAHMAAATRAVTRGALLLAFQHAMARPAPRTKRR